MGGQTRSFHTKVSRVQSGGGYDRMLIYIAQLIFLFHPSPSRRCNAHLLIDLPTSATTQSTFFPDCRRACTFIYENECQMTFELVIPCLNAHIVTL